MAYQHYSSVKCKYTNTMSEENFNQIIDAILAGKYSWACVLILQSAGYDPVDYIPYRTYNRLIKNNCIAASSTQARKQQKHCSSAKNKQNDQSISEIQDLKYLKPMQKESVKGGKKAGLTLVLPF